MKYIPSCNLCQICFGVLHIKPHMISSVTLLPPVLVLLCARCRSRGIKIK